jgi:hypothetical protein
MKRLFLFLVCLALAAASFGYARHRYVQQNTATLRLGDKSTRLSNPLADDKLFGPWAKDSWPLAIALPSALAGIGLVLLLKKK